MPNTLPLPPTPAVNLGPTSEPAIEPLMVDIRYLSHLLSTSVPTLWRWDASGTLGPRGFKRGGKKLFRLSELKQWVKEGMPDRKTWEALTAQRNGRPR